MTSRSFSALISALAIASVIPTLAQSTFSERSATLLNHLNSTTPNLGQTGGGPHRIGRTGFWYGQGRIARGNQAVGLQYIATAVADADAEGANAGFSLWPGMDAWYRHNAIFPQSLKDQFRNEYVGARYYGGATPNQRLMGATACYLASEIWGAAAVTANSNASNGYGDPTGRAFIHHLLDQLPRYNSEEHNSGQYLTFNLGPFHTLSNFAPDPLMRQKARMGVDWLLADAAPTWLNGYACVSNTRGRVAPPQNSYSGTTNLGWWLFFGGPNPANLLDVNLHTQYALPDFRGVPPEILTAATDRTRSFTRRSVAQRYIGGRKNAHFKQTWMTPSYAMWSQVEADVSLNPDGSLRVNHYDPPTIQDGYQGERWGIAWNDPPSGDSVITIKSPTTYRGTTSGISVYEDTLQDEDTLLAVYNIPEPSGQTGNDGSYPNQYVRGTIPNGYLAYIDESETSGRLFLHYNQILVSIYLTNPFANFSGSPGFLHNCSKLGVVVETASPTEFSQETPAARLAAFRSQILATTTDASGINLPAPRLTYTNRKGKTLSLTYGQAGAINGDPVDYLQWPTLENPWMHQPPQSNLTLFGQNRKVLYNFNDWTITTNNRPQATEPANPLPSLGATPIEIDLATLVQDAETPANRLRFKLQDRTQGAVTLLADGRTARFSPAANMSGTAGFSFTATDTGNDHRHVLHYDFESDQLGTTIIDRSGNDRHASPGKIGTGSLTSSSAVPSALRNHSQASLQLNSSSIGSAKFSRQIYPANVHLSNGSWTFATWFNRNSYADDDILLYIGSGDGFGGDGDELQLHCPAQQAAIRLLHYSQNQVVDVDLLANLAPTQQWHHVAVRFQRTGHQIGTVSLFLNGSLVGSVPNVSWSLLQSSPVFFGGPARSSVLQRDFNGSIDDLVLFRDALKDTEIVDLAQAAVAHSGGLSLTRSVEFSSPPLAPSGLDISASSANAVQLNWLNPGPNTSVAIERATSPEGPFTRIASSLNSQTFSDASLSPGTTYFYRLIASSPTGTSSPSATMRITTPIGDLTPWAPGTMAGWSHAARLRFPGYAQAETLTDFPVLVTISAASIPGFSYAQLAHPNGADLRFTDASGSTVLSHEIDTWNPTGTSTVWVKLPSLSANTTILAFWGNPNTPSTPPDGSSTWSNGYLGVFHLRETSGQCISSTPGAPTTRSVSVANQGTATGIVGGACSFNGSSHFVSLPNFGNPTQVTVEAWVNLAATPGSNGAGIVSADAWTVGNVHFRANANRSCSVAANGNGQVTSAAGALSVGSFAHVAYTLAGAGNTDLSLFFNGVPAGSAKGHASTNLTNAIIGREFNTRFLNGTVDEVRISQVARSAAWLRTCHDTIRSPQTFCTAEPTVFRDPTIPAVIVTRSATNVTTNSATLNASLIDSGGLPTQVTLYWGPTDGGTTPNLWLNQTQLGIRPVGELSLPLTTLNPSTTYFFRAFATNANGSRWSADSTAFTTTPTPPEGVSLTASGNDVTLRWNAAQGVRHYAIERATSASGPWQPIPNRIIGTSYTDPTALPDSTWHYRITAHGDGGASSPSTSISVLPLIPPASLSAIPSNANVSLSWSAVANASAYRILRATSSSGPFSEIGTTSATNWSDATATNLTRWFYVVRATGPRSESADSPQVAATPLANLPAPTGVTATPASTSVTLRWNAVPNAQTYRVLRSSSRGGPYTTIATQLIAPTFTDTGLTNGVTQFYVVTANNETVVSPLSAEVSTTPAPPPTAFTTSSSGNWSAAMWSPSAPIAGFATSLSLNLGSANPSVANLGNFLLNQLQLPGQAVTLSGDPLVFSGSNPAIVTSSSASHSIANPISSDTQLTLSVPANSLTLSSSISGIGSLLKSGAGQLSVTGPLSYPGPTTIQGGSLQPLADLQVPGTLVIGASAGAAIQAQIALSQASASFSGYIQQNHHTTPNTCVIGANRSLTIRGDVLIGTYHAATTSNTRLNVSGSGALRVLSDAGTFALGSCPSGSGVVSTLDLSSLSEFQLIYPSEGGFLTIGNGASISNQTSTLILANQNLIEVDSIQIANQQVSNATQRLLLGSGTNVIRTESISIGTTASPSGGGRGIGEFRFHGSQGSLVLRDPSGSSGTNLFIADSGGNGNGFGTFDVTGHHADLKLLSLRMGASTNATARTDRFSFDQGFLDITTLDIGISQAGATRTSIVTLGGGTINLGIDENQTSGSISLARNAVGELNLTGGTISAHADITESVGTGSATLLLDGANLDLRGHAINQVTNVILRRGTLQNVAEINSGAPLTKSGTGTLVLAGNNTFNNPITIAEGILQVASNHTLLAPISGPGLLTISGSLSGTGTIDAPTEVHGTLAPRTGGITISQPITFSPSSRLQTTLTTNSDASGSLPGVTTTAPLVTNTTIDVVLNATGSAVDLNQTFWSTSRSWRILTAPSVSALCSLGSVTNDPAGVNPASKGNFSLTHDATGVTLLWTPLTPLESWRFQNFGTSANAGNAADQADPDDDGVTNATEFTSVTNPNDPTSRPSFVWTQPSSGNWSSPSQWNLNLRPPSHPATRLEFLPGMTSLPTGPIIATNDLPGPLVLNSLRLAGSNSTTSAINLTGAPLEFRSYGSSPPIIRLNANPSVVSYTVSNDLILTADTTFEAANTGRFTFSGVISGPGGITRTSTWSTLILSGNNSYQGTTSIPSGGSIQFGSDGPTGSPGPGPIMNLGTLRIDRSGLLELSNTISGSGSVFIDNPTATDTVLLSGNNAFSGNITVNRGTLRLNRAEAIGLGSKLLLMQGTERRLQLSNHITLPTSLTIVASTNSGDGAGISNADGNNTIAGPIQISTGNAALNLSSISGRLTVTGAITPTTSGRSLILGGSSTSPNTIAGTISNGSTTALPVTKQGSGSWTLANQHSYTGPTTINAGTLILSGSITSEVITQGGTLAIRGAPSTSSHFSLAAAATLNTPPQDTFRVAGSVTLAGRLELALPPPTGPAAPWTLLEKTSAGPITGTFANLPEGSTIQAENTTWTISYLGGDGNDVVLTPFQPPTPTTPLERWRETYFATLANSGPSANTADPDHDGEPNLLEFATGQSPLTGSRVVQSCSTEVGQPAKFRYQRNRAAVEQGIQFDIQSTSTLAPHDWSSLGDGTIITDGPIQTVEYLLPHPLPAQNYLRVRVAIE